MARGLARAAVMALVLGAGGAFVVGQGVALAADAAYRAPRLPGTSHPDLNGVWQGLNGADNGVEPHAAAAAFALRSGPAGPVPAKEVVALGAVGAVPATLGVVEGGEIPYTPEARKIRDENHAKWLERDPEIKCYLPGVPRANYMAFPFQIIQSDKDVVLAYEFAGAVRNLLFTDPGPSPADSWMGQSVAHWEGDSLVVKVTGFNDRTWLDRMGNHHSDALEVTERYTPLNPGAMRYEATLTDPQTYTQPWKMSMILYRRIGPDARLQQFKCVEFVEELMYGKLRKNPLP